MAMKKRIIAASVCSALLIVGGVIGMGANTSYGGPGNGTNKKVTDLETMAEVLDSFSARQRSDKSSSLSRKSGSSEYNSCTVVETSEVYASNSSYSSYSNAGGHRSEEASNTASFNRTLNIYFGENASYYESEVRMTNSSSQSVSYSSYGNSDSSYTAERTTKTTLEMKLKIYISDESVMLYIDRLNYFYYDKRSDTRYEKSDKNYETYNHKYTDKDTSTGKAYGVLKGYCNRWIDCSDYPEIAQGFLSVDNSNLQSLSSFSSFIKTQINSEDKVLKKSGDVYKLKESAMLEFFGLSSIKDIADTNGSLTVDLSSHTKPEIYYDLSLKASDSTSENGSYDYNNYAYIKDGYVFKNIGNTVVKQPKASGVDINEINDRIEELEEEYE